MKLENISFKKIPVGASNATGQVGLISFELNDIRINGVKVFKNNSSYTYKYPQFTDTRGTRYNVCGIVDSELLKKVNLELDKASEEELTKCKKSPLPSYHK